MVGAEESLVPRGGGNNSVKTTAIDLLGKSIEVMLIKSSESDTKTIVPKQFPAAGSWRWREESSAFGEHAQPDSIFDGSHFWSEEMRAMRAPAYRIDAACLPEYYRNRTLLKTTDEFLFLRCAQLRQ